MGCYFTGSKAEGLNLVGSDYDFMFDVNSIKDVHVSESMQDLFSSRHTNKFLMVTDDVPPGFAMLIVAGEMKDDFL